MASDIKSKSSVSFSGWGASAQASFAHNSVKKCKKNTVIFRSQRNIDLGYSGYDLGDAPKLTSSAKEFLLRHGR